MDNTPVSGGTGARRRNSAWSTMRARASTRGRTSGASMSQSRRTRSRSGVRTTCTSAPNRSACFQRVESFQHRERLVFPGGSAQFRQAVVGGVGPRRRDGGCACTADRWRFSPRGAFGLSGAGGAVSLPPKDTASSKQRQLATRGRPAGPRRAPATRPRKPPRPVATFLVAASAQRPKGRVSSVNP